MSAKSPKRPMMTTRLDAEERQTLIIPALGTFDTRFETENITYHPVPSNHASLKNAPVWRIKIKFGSMDRRVLTGLDIYGDTVIGRGSDAPDGPDIDLSNLDALKLGVSRRHALLRPTANKLYLIDLQSTNGTFVNAILVSRGMAQVIRNHDGIAFAGLTCVVEIVASPSYPLAAGADAPAEGEPADVSGSLKISKPKIGRQTIVGVKLDHPSATPEKDDKDKESKDKES